MVEEVKNLHTNDKLIASLEHILEEAKAGKVHGCIMYYEPVSTIDYTNYYAFHGFNNLEALGACQRLTYLINNDWDDKYKEE